MTQKRALYIVTSSYPEIAKRIFSEKLSLLFGNFEMVPVETFDVKTSQEFIRHKLGTIKMGEDLQNFLIDFTAGHPLYLNLILQKLINLSLMHKQEEIFSPILILAIENTLFDKWSLIGRQFDLIMQELCAGKGNRIFAPMLIALAEHKLKLKDLAKQLNMSQALFSPKITRLLENGIIEKHGHYFCIKDKLFRYWIKYVFHKKLKTIDLNINKLKSDFAQEINQLINNFKSNSTKDLSLRVKELLSCFDNESFNINGRRYKLPLFHDIAPWPGMPSPESFQVIKACCEEGSWFIVFKHESFSENDIHLFLKELRDREEKPFKCVMISLSELDPNARLKALQERVWIWDEEELKTFLNFYDKPFII
ncbi:MAG: hypothetical protein A2Z88_05880 [Omnitrophica WOR_2 bacterium GWA2_47_8]|nr:MAG: hypothetical protein A2Z88_05880 [Omnitrophica WOR_2 bacterium GWA2_47_8]